MGLISHGIAFGLGYAVARPDGRRQLRERLLELSRRPEVTRMTERGRTIAVDRVRAATTRAATTRATRPGVEIEGPEPVSLAGLVPGLRDRLIRARPAPAPDRPVPPVTPSRP